MELIFYSTLGRIIIYQLGGEGEESVEFWGDIMVSRGKGEDQSSLTEYTTGGLEN